MGRMSAFRMIRSDFTREIETPKKKREDFHCSTTPSDFSITDIYTQIFLWRCIGDTWVSGTPFFLYIEEYT